MKTQPLGWRAILDSNQWPSAPEADAVLPNQAAPGRNYLNLLHAICMPFRIRRTKPHQQSESLLTPLLTPIDVRQVKSSQVGSGC